ncbi:MAG: carbohydrate ABC transporter permease, partial [Burkholderiales bacterium]
MPPVSGSVAASDALARERVQVSRLTRALENEKLLAVALIAPAVIILVLFIAYPFVMAIWLSLTNLRVGGVGDFVGLDNFVKAWNDTIFQTVFRNTFFYTFWATVFKLALGMWLALLLNRHFRLKRIVR